MRERITATGKVLASVGRLLWRRAGTGLDLRDIAQLVAPFLLPLIGVLVQENIPGVRNLYPWVFPTILAGIAFATLVFIVAVQYRLRIDTGLRRRAQAYRSLVTLRSKGIDLRNNGMPPHFAGVTDIPQWDAEVDSWHDDVCKGLAVISVRDFNHFDTLDWVSQRHDSRMNFTSEHAKRLNELSESLERLKEIVDRHADDSSLNVPV